MRAAAQVAARWPYQRVLPGGRIARRCQGPGCPPGGETESGTSVAEMTAKYRDRSCQKTPIGRRQHQHLHGPYPAASATLRQRRSASSRDRASRSRYWCPTAREAIDDPERRRIRGVAAQSVFVAFLFFAANVRKIDEFMAGRPRRPRGSASSLADAAPLAR